MRRRVRESGPGVAPLPLQRYRGSSTSNREKAAWLRARQDWWDSVHDFEDPGDLQWLFDGFDLVGLGDWHFCGSIGAPCGDDDCLCAFEQEAAT